MTVAAADHHVTVAELPSGQFVVTASGDLEGDGARALKDVLYPLAAAQDASVVVDIAAASRVDVTALGVVEGAAVLVAARGGELVVVSPNPRIRYRLSLAPSPVRVEGALTDTGRSGT